MNVELVNTEPWLLGKIQLGLWSQTFSIHTLDLCVFLFKDTLYNVHCWCINTELMSEGSLYNTCLFYVQHSLLVLGNTKLNTMLGGHFKSKIIDKKHKNAKNMTPNKLWKGHMFMYESWDKKAELTLFNVSWKGMWLKFFATQCVSMNDCENATSTDFGVANKFY